MKADCRCRRFACPLLIPGAAAQSVSFAQHHDAALSLHLVSVRPLQVDTSKGAGHAMCFSLKVSCCPCCVQPCTESRKAAWRRLFRSASWWIAIIDVIMLIVSISIQGFAPPSVNPMLGPPGNVLNMLQVRRNCRQPRTLLF